ncbi:vacuolar iron transporter homolog 2-like [Quercus robur]|uniref:vacuolar iron transporter homolog 2-like n=1 Tax=Quercus robur TaxID=38942 RepID=UPI0021616BF7|nr:vacuolar iron transporter homolog 2-like [Quercus robur]
MVIFMWMIFGNVRSGGPVFTAKSAVYPGDFRYEKFDVVVVEKDGDDLKNKKEHQNGQRWKKGAVPSPTLVAEASSATYLVGGSVLLLAAGFIKQKEWRSSAVMTLSPLSLFLVGVIGAALGKAPLARSCARV